MIDGAYEYGDLLYLAFVDLETQIPFAEFPTDLDITTDQLVQKAMSVLVASLENGGDDIMDTIEMNNAVLHCFFEKETLIGIVLITLGHEYPDHLSKNLLMELSRKIDDIDRMYGIKDPRNFDYQAALDGFMGELMHKYANCDTANVAEMVRFKVEGTKGVVKDDIKEIMANVVNMEILAKKTRTMNFTAQAMHDHTLDLNKCMQRRTVVVSGELIV
ncbi:hypothetical protein BdWA1_000087 [Babesia duncani]|uniref:Uncharacterized protein n=1 Tax=Babesia duncani TaxID=323732 RepID=A0AAD9PLJ8_9APIC|nr:hypothetical protein BdWA1_000087 [Babesia duncani]